MLLERETNVAGDGELLKLVSPFVERVNVLHPLHQGGSNRQFLVRARLDTTGKVVTRTTRTDELVEFTICKETRRKKPTLPLHWRVRRIRYRTKGSKEQTLLTSLLHPTKNPAKEIVALYHERWEIEMGFDELKTDMLERNVPMRSQTPHGVRQKLWSVLLAYNIVRREMEQVAKEANVSPLGISFIASYRFIRDEFLWCAVARPGTIPAHLKRLRQQLSLFLLPKRRSARRYLRAVKRKVYTEPQGSPWVQDPVVKYVRNYQITDGPRFH